MRAARVLDLLLVLQHRGRTTAAELARTFDVSPRTVLRDVEALSEAGVPVYTVRGAGGGIALLDGFRTHLTGLTADEATCLFLVGQPGVAHRLGLAAPTRAVRHKLLTALSPDLADQADRLGGWFLHDPDPWSGHRVPHGELRRLARAVREQRRVELLASSGPARPVHPLGLVLKAGDWYLVDAGVDPELGARVVPLDDLRGTRLTRQRFAPPPGFHLARFWAEHLGTTHVDGAHLDGVAPA